MIRWLALILVSLGLMTTSAEERRMALLIGNQSYDTEGLSPLQNPHGDVDRVAAALREAGFGDVVVLKDQDEGQMREAIMAFAGKLSEAGEAGIGFFYYSGHGAALEKEDRTRVSYLIPTGEPVTYAEQLESYGVPLTEQVNRLSSTGAGAVFVVIDACRNTLEYRFRKSAGVKGIGSVSAPGGLLIAYAAADGHWADDDPIFSTALAAEIVKPGQTAETAFLNVSRAVGARKQGINRLPVIQPRLSKTVCFNGCAAGVNVELAAFGQIRDCAGARGFLERYPNSAYRLQVETMAAGFCATGLKPGDEFRDCADCPEMVVVPAGSFTMGSPASEKGRQDDEGPQRTVRIGSPFAVGKTEVTVAQYRAFVETTGRTTEGNCWADFDGDGSWSQTPEANWQNAGFSQTVSHPVVCVSWEDAQAYVEWLSGQTGERYRLLSEAEWEYVARAGTMTRYAFGDQITKSQAQFSEEDWGSAKQTVSVGSFPANAFGIHDMHGNVLEWTQDCYVDSYSGAPMDAAARVVNDCSLRVLRGGSWGLNPLVLRSAGRNWNDPTNRINYIGFRVARTLVL